jgi:hypothetical protein
MVGAMVVYGQKATKEMILSIKTIKITIDYSSIGELRFVQFSRKTGHCVKRIERRWSEEHRYDLQRAISDGSW